MNGLHKPSQSGFTLVEVMIAIGIMTVGSLGILSMHQAVSGANRSAQEMNTALAITERWVERVERDSSFAFDHFGDDTPSTGDIKYCTNLRLSWLRQGSSARVDIRTFWYREGYLIGNATHSKWVAGADFRGAACDAATADGWDLGEAPNVNVVFASTVVTWLRR
jgi:prepilin-type N-terminal cleavage/methylation domain-containing protein